MAKYTILRKVIKPENVEVLSGPLDVNQEYMQTGKSYPDVETAKQWIADSCTVYCIAEESEQASPDNE